VRFRGSVADAVPCRAVPCRAAPCRPRNAGGAFENHGASNDPDCEDGFRRPA